MHTAAASSLKHTDVFMQRQPISILFIFRASVFQISDKLRSISLVISLFRGVTIATQKFIFGI